jgi:hypothetical protein
MKLVLANVHVELLRFLDVSTVITTSVDIAIRLIEYLVAQGLGLGEKAVSGYNIFK